MVQLMRHRNPSQKNLSAQLQLVNEVGLIALAIAEQFARHSLKVLSQQKFEIQQQLLLVFVPFVQLMLEQLIGQTFTTHALLLSQQQPEIQQQLLLVFVPFVQLMLEQLMRHRNPSQKNLSAQLQLVNEVGLIALAIAEQFARHSLKVLSQQKFEIQQQLSLVFVPFVQFMFEQLICQTFTTHAKSLPFQSQPEIQEQLSLLPVIFVQLMLEQFIWHRNSSQKNFSTQLQLVNEVSYKAQAIAEQFARHSLKVLSQQKFEIQQQLLLVFVPFVQLMLEQLIGQTFTTHALLLSQQQPEIQQQLLLVFVPFVQLMLEQLMRHRNPSQKNLSAQLQLVNEVGLIALAIAEQFARHSLKVLSQQKFEIQQQLSLVFVPFVQFMFEQLICQTFTTHAKSLPFQSQPEIQEQLSLLPVIFVQLMLEQFIWHRNSSQKNFSTQLQLVNEVSYKAQAIAEQFARHSLKVLSQQKFEIQQQLLLVFVPFVQLMLEQLIGQTFTTHALLLSQQQPEIQQQLLLVFVPFVQLMLEQLMRHRNPSQKNLSAQLQLVNEVGLIALAIAEQFARHSLKVLSQQKFEIQQQLSLVFVPFVQFMFEQLVGSVNPKQTLPFQVRFFPNIHEQFSTSVFLRASVMAEQFLWQFPPFQKKPFSQAQLQILIPVEIEPVIWEQLGTQPKTQSFQQYVLMQIQLPEPVGPVVKGKLLQLTPQFVILSVIFCSGLTIVLFKQEPLAQVHPAQHLQLVALLLVIEFSILVQLIQHSPLLQLYPIMQKQLVRDLDFPFEPGMLAQSITHWSLFHKQPVLHRQFRESMLDRAF